MAFKKKFLHAYTSISCIPKGRLITGILLGLLFAFSFYSFLYVCREAFRILCFRTEEYDILVLSDAVVSLFNLILAYIATIMGQSLCFAYWLGVPLSRFGKHAFRIRAIINDQRSMNSYFLSWFSRLACVFALILGGTMGGDLYVIQTFSGYKFVFVLIILVLFLHTWNNLRRLFNGKSFKWMLFSATILSLLSFGLSQINLIDYKAINEIALRHNVFHTHRLNLPESVHTERMNSEYRRRATLWIAEEKDKPAGSEPVIYIKHNGDRSGTNAPVKLPIDSLKERFARWDQDLWYEAMYEPTVLYIHRDIKMKYINKVKQQLAGLEAFRVQFAVLPPVREYSEKYYNYLAFPLRIPAYYTDPQVWQEMQKELATIRNAYDLRTTDSDTLLWNNIEISHQDFKNFVREIIEVDPDYYINYHINDDSPYAEYIFIMANIMQAINELRDKYAFEVYGKEYDDIYDEEIRKEIREKFPYRVVEIYNH